MFRGGFHMFCVPLLLQVLLINPDQERKHKNSIWLLCWSVFSHNLLLGLSASKSKLAKKLHTQTHTCKVTLMLSAACWHMAASHTKTEALEFSISIPKPWWLPLLQSGTVCARCCSRATDWTRAKVCRARRGTKNIRLQIWMLAQMEVMEENAQCLIASSTTLIN